MHEREFRWTIVLYSTFFISSCLRCALPVDLDTRWSSLGLSLRGQYNDRKVYAILHLATNHHPSVIRLILQSPLSIRLLIPVTLTSQQSFKLIYICMPTVFSSCRRNRFTPQASSFFCQPCHSINLSKPYTLECLYLYLFENHVERCSQCILILDGHIPYCCVQGQALECFVVLSF